MKCSSKFKEIKLLPQVIFEAEISHYKKIFSRRFSNTSSGVIRFGVLRELPLFLSTYQNNTLATSLCTMHGQGRICH